VILLWVGKTRVIIGKSVPERRSRTCTGKFSQQNNLTSLICW
jgi:hypothetical protein